MASHGIHYDAQPAMAVNVTSIVADGTTTGNIIDTQYFEGVEFFLFAGAYTTGTVTPLVQEGDAANLSDATTVDATYLLGTTATQTLTAANDTAWIGYVGKKRYVRLNLVGTGTSVMTAGAVAVLNHAHSKPTDQTISGS